MRTNWGLVALIWLAGLCAAGQFAKVAVVFDLIAPRWPGAGLALGLVVSVVGFVGIVFGTSAGIAVARIGARRMMLAGLSAAALVSLAEATLPPLWPMIALRVFEGLAHLAIVVAGPVLIAQVSKPEDQAATMTLWSTFFGLTFALVAYFGRPFAEAQGVAALFLAHAGLTALVALALAASLPRGRAPGAVALSLGQVWRDHRRIYASPRIAAPAMGFMFYTFMFVALLTLVPGLLPPEDHGAAALWMPLLSIAASILLGVALVRRFGAVRVVQAGFVIAALFAALWGLAPGLRLWAALGLSAATGLLQGASFAAIPELNATAQDRAQAAGAIAQLGNVGTTLGTPLLLALTQAFGPGSVAWFCLPLCAAGIAVHQWNARRRLFGGG